MALVLVRRIRLLLTLSCGDDGNGDDDYEPYNAGPEQGDATGGDGVENQDITTLTTLVHQTEEQMILEDLEHARAVEEHEDDDDDNDQGDDDEDQDDDQDEDSDRNAPVDWPSQSTTLVNEFTTPRLQSIILLAHLRECEDVGLRQSQYYLTYTTNGISILSLASEQRTNGRTESGSGVGRKLGSGPGRRGPLWSDSVS